jgi:hypothetical protein
MKTLLLGLLLVCFAASPSWAAGLRLSIQGGRVTIDAEDVTVRQILTEWARVGQTRIINLERITGGPITLKLDAVPEKQALDIVLRTVPGYVTQTRQTLVADASIYDRILIMASTTAVASTRPPAPALPGMQPGANVTQLRPPRPSQLLPGLLPEPPDPADDADDPAIAAAAAAGLVAVPAPAPGPSSISAPLMAPGAAQPTPAQPPGTAAAPVNPWNAPAGTAVPTFAPPPAPPAPINTPVTRTRPPLPDR